MSELNVKIGADIDGLRKGLKQSDKELKNFEKGIKSGSEGLDKMTATSRKGSTALISFNRLVQDAPFGLMGMSNNITDLAETFGRLKQETGSTRGAIGSMIQSLKGAGGLSFAISLATSLALMFGDQLFKTAKKANELTEATKDLIGSSKSEITTLKSLLSIAKDENQQKDNRERAIAKINDLYKDYLPNLTTENINTERVAKSVDMLSNSLLRQAKIKGLSSRISDLYSKRYEVENENIAKQASLYRKGVLGLASLFGATSTAKAGADAFASGLQNQKESLAEVDKEIKKLEKSFNDLISEDIGLDGIFTGTKNGGGAEESVRNTVVSVGAILKDGVNGIRENLESLPPIEILSQKDIDANAGRLAYMKKLMIDFSEAISQTISQNVAGAFDGIGQAIGNALSGAGNLADNLGKVLLGSVGNLLTQLGRLAISVGVGLLGIKKALQSLNPAAAIAAGVGLIALGKLFSNKASELGNSIGGSGSVSTNTSTGSVSGSSFTNGATGGFGGGTVVFEIAGTKLVGVLDNTLRQNRNIGGVLKIG